MTLDELKKYLGDNDAEYQLMYLLGRQVGKKANVAGLEFELLSVESVDDPDTWRGQTEAYTFRLGEFTLKTEMSFSSWGEDDASRTLYYMEFVNE